MYRCGSTYQDQPCSGHEEGKIVGSTGASRSSLPAHSSDAECARMGEDSRKIAWAREAGAMKEDAMARASSPRERELVEKVYILRGTSSEISAAIAADCVSEKERAAQAAALIQEAQRLSPPGQANAPMGASNSRAVGQRNTEAAPQNKSADDSQARKQQCDRLRENLIRIANQQRQGGSAATMENLKQQQREVQSALDTAHCR